MLKVQNINADDYDWLVMAIMHHWVYLQHSRRKNSPFYKISRNLATKADFNLMERATKKLDKILEGGLSG